MDNKMKIIKDEEYYEYYVHGRKLPVTISNNIRNIEYYIRYAIYNIDMLHDEN